MKSLFKSVQNSSLWAVAGDALGFITELIDENGLSKRIGAKRVENTVPWSKFVGGRFGAIAELPAGCYSDDTQLRFCTSRAIRGNGFFDAEAFAKIELPVWLSYSLGAGRGTKIAANSFAKQDVNWFSNFFNGKNSYLSAGGNGAAMRIQPHVWSANDLSKPDIIISNVIKNAICTHGHPRGFLGAVFHALSLIETLKNGKVPGPAEWKDFVSYFQQVKEIISEDNDLNTFWLPVWEERSRKNLETACEETTKECLEDLKTIEKFLSSPPAKAYEKMVDAIGCRTNKYRGTGTKTAILASALCWIHKDDRTIDAILNSSNLLNSDTDTISTMAGAILGVVSESPPEIDIMDKEYIKSEAIRLHKISQCKNADSFKYPDIFSWTPPSTQLASLGVINEQVYIAGLSNGKFKGKPFSSRGNNDYVWQWVLLDFGQTILCKRRSNPAPLPKGNLPLDQNIEMVQNRSKIYKNGDLFPKNDIAKKGHNVEKTKLPVSIDYLTTEAIKSDFNEATIGKHILELISEPDGIEKAIAYTAIIGKAKIARRTSSKK